MEKQWGYHHVLHLDSSWLSLGVKLLPIAVILVVGAVLRLQHLRQPFVDAFSWRETDTAMIAANFYQGDWNILYPEVDWAGPKPGYQGREFQTVTYLAALIYKLVGQQDWVGRLISIAFGLLGIFALYQLVRRVWDEKRALLSAAVIAVLPGGIFIERSFLPDPAMVALVVTSFWMLVVYLQTEKRSYLVLASVFGALGFCTKIPGLIIALPMSYAVLEILYRQKKLQLKRLALLSLVAFVTLVPIVAYYVWARNLANAYPPYHFAGEGNWLWNDGLDNWLNQAYFFPQLSSQYTVWLWTEPVIVLVLAGLVLRPPRQENSRLQGTPWVFHWWILAGIIYYLIGAKELVNNPWNFHIVAPAAAALAAHAVVTVGGFLAHRIQILILQKWALDLSLLIAAVLLILIVLVGQERLQYMYFPYARQSYELGLALEQMAEPDALVVTVANDVGDPTAIYYSRRNGWVYPPARPHQAWNYIPPESAEAIQLFEQLRSDGADWFGIVEEQKQALWANHTALMQYVEQTSELAFQGENYTIYRIMTPDEIG